MFHCITKTRRTKRMIDRKEIIEIAESYYTDDIKIGTVASHSGLDVFDGAIEENFETFAICQAGREKTYTEYFKSKRDANGKVVRGIVDDHVVYDKFNELMLP